jgi:hydroxymethylglutaryl-CoA reductase (NADPH)
MGGWGFEGEVPLATYETPLWASVARGAAVTAHAGGIRAVVQDDRMARSVLLEAPDAAGAAEVARWVGESKGELAAVVAGTSRHARLLEARAETAGRLVFVRIECATGEASGHNMVTRAADAALAWILEKRPECAYGSVSGNLCCDKKVSAVNGLLGRGKRVTAEAVVGRRLVERFLHTTPEKIERLCWRKNWVGSVLAGGVRSANAHAANMLLAFYLATGQDAANIVEGSQCFTMAEVSGGGDLRFSCTLPNLIVGTVGNGKGLPGVAAAIGRLGCAREGGEDGANSRQLARICAAVVLCGELSLLAAQTNPGELMSAHLKIERGVEA